MKANKPGAVRTCIGCRARRNQGEMTRLALKGAENALAVRRDAKRAAGGRGAWLCRDSEACLRLAVKKLAFGRAFKAEGPLDLTDLETLSGPNSVASIF